MSTNGQPLSRNKTSWLKSGTRAVIHVAHHNSMTIDQYRESVAGLKKPGTLFKEIHFRVVLLREGAIIMHMTKTRSVKQTNSKISRYVSILNSTMILRR